MSDLELTMMKRVGELNKEVAALKAENARLKAEVERLTKMKQDLFDSNDQQVKHIERLEKAGDAMAEIVNGTYCVEPPQALKDWNAAKGVQS